MFQKSRNYGGAVMTLDMRGRLVLDWNVFKSGGGYDKQFKAAKLLGAALDKKRQVSR